jgi:predicted RNA binding protein YcfA (HicA-like mRNA interferase family)
MSKKEKRLKALLSFPNTMRFTEVRGVLEDNGYSLERTKGSHHIFTKKESTTITVPVHKNNVKIDYLKLIAKALDLKEEK